MFDHFTEHAKTAMNLARQEAQQWGHARLDSEHMLLALLQVDGCLALDVLAGLGIGPDRVRTETERQLRPQHASEDGAPPFTPRAKLVLTLSMEEASALGHDHIGTEHLLLGLIREREHTGRVLAEIREGGHASRVLAELGAEIVAAREKVCECLAGDFAGTPEHALLDYVLLGSGEDEDEPTVGWREQLRSLTREERQRVREFLEELDREDEARG